MVCSHCDGDRIVLVVGGHIPCYKCMSSSAFIRTVGNDHIIIGISVLDTWDMAFLSWLHTKEKVRGFTAVWLADQNAYRVPIYLIGEAEAELKKYYENVEVFQAIPAQPVTYRVEYIGACKKRVNYDRNVYGQKVTTCVTCGGSGVHRITGGRYGVNNPACPICNGTGRMTLTDTTESY